MKSSKATWEVAIREAAHLVTIMHVGGTPSDIQKIYVLSNWGSIQTASPIQNAYYGLLLQAVIAASGIACASIRGYSLPEGDGSDAEVLSGLLSNPEAEAPLVIDKTRQWLQSKWDLVEWTATQLMYAPKRNGAVTQTQVKRIVSELQDRLPQRKIKSC